MRSSLGKEHTVRLPSRETTRLPVLIAIGGHKSGNLLITKLTFSLTCKFVKKFFHVNRLN